ncbi:GIY-YIG nuclease family protein [Desulfosporosinus sp. Sb-LF]|uniref:GIY-YIG nuclease family protein n=1 Tax=Desulfosporosinus sp. Sb-LF TaxID=2560027 RepID=UPI00107F37E0|nr:GIY-YIG nuclease family protein [Desulfosporosinus sp. Sb-LF]TGE31008.1 GIY-YIG nuclease family protein [Desulfosporosinus sp. Sb-LF]
MDRKKELKEQYRQMKPDMGIFIIRSTLSNKCFIKKTPNLKGAMNSTLFQLEGGGHPNRELQKEWKDCGEEKFIIEILEKLEYDKDELRTDYTEDLTLLQMIWEEKLAKENLEFY